MTYLLEVPIRLQPNPSSCWWQCLASLLEYHEGRRLSYPWELDEVFRPPMSTLRARGPLHAARYHDATGRIPAMSPMDHRSRKDGRARDLFHALIASTFGLLEPHRWYELGVPVRDGGLHLELLTYLARLQQVPFRLRREAFVVTRDYPTVERVLRTYGPVMFVMQAGIGHHALLLHGVVHEESLGTQFSHLKVLDPERGLTNLTIRELFARMEGHIGHYRALGATRRRATPRVSEIP